MNYHWYPGHMTKAKRMMQEDIRLIDVILELVDARIPYASRNPDLRDLGKNKARVILLNKADLADQEGNRLWVEHMQKEGARVCPINAKSGAGMSAVQKVILEACGEKLARDRARGIQNRPVRAMVVGIPNVGKSTFINRFAGRACTKTGNRPGVTKGKQWIRINKSVELLDTPGILWPKFADASVGEHLAMTGSIKDEILPAEELAISEIRLLQAHYGGRIEERYRCDASLPPADVLGEIARNRGCLKKGNEPDLEKAAQVFLDDFRNGRLGQLTLEWPPQEAQGVRQKEPQEAQGAEQKEPQEAQDAGQKEPQEAQGAGQKEPQEAQGAGQKEPQEAQGAGQERQGADGTKTDES